MCSGSRLFHACSPPMLESEFRPASHKPAPCTSQPACRLAHGYTENSPESALLCSPSHAPSLVGLSGRLPAVELSRPTTPGHPLPNRLYTSSWPPCRCLYGPCSAPETRPVTLCDPHIISESQTQCWLNVLVACATPPITATLGLLALRRLRERHPLASAAAPRTCSRLLSLHSLPCAQAARKPLSSTDASHVVGFRCATEPCQAILCNA